MIPQNTILYKEGEAALYKLNRQLREPFKIALLKDLQALTYFKEFGRNTSWLGEPGLNYIYANRNHRATGWTKRTRILTDYLIDNIYLEWQPALNHLLVNQYLAGQSLAPHRDDEPDLVGPIVSLSLGDTATFDYTEGKIDLEDGDILVGSRKFFDTVTHSVSQPHNDQVRYNLTWRTVLAP